MAGLKRITLIRHGQTDYTKQRLFCGKADPPLTAYGIRCAQTLAAHPLLTNPDLLLSSPSQRALDTATLVARALKTPTISDAGFAETDFGEWEGVSYEDVQGTPAYEAWSRNPALWSPPGGENGITVQARAMTALVRYLECADDIALFSHKGTIRLIYSFFLKLPASDYRRLPDVPPASVSTISLRHGDIVQTLLGDTSHLDGVLPAEQDCPASTHPGVVGQVASPLAKGHQ